MIKYGKALTSTNRKHIQDLKLFSFNDFTKDLKDWSPDSKEDNVLLGLRSLVLFALCKAGNKR